MHAAVCRTDSSVLRGVHSAQSFLVAVLYPLHYGCQKIVHSQHLRKRLLIFLGFDVCTYVDEYLFYIRDGSNEQNEHMDKQKARQGENEYMMMPWTGGVGTNDVERSNIQFWCFELY